MDDVLGYEGRHAVVTGAASGMGAETARILGDLGAEVTAVDLAEPAFDVAAFHQTDLRDEAAIAATAEAIGAPVDALFNCAGLPQTFPDLDVMLVNFVGLRELTERLVPKMRDGSSISCIASVAGMAWIQNVATLTEWVTTPSFAEARQWAEDHPDLTAAAYSTTKEAINLYVARRSNELIGDGIRINCLNPGPTDTPMMPHFEDAMGKDYMDAFPKPIGRNSRPEEQAWPLVLLGSPRCSYVVGTALFADGGFTGGLFTGQVDPSVLMPADD